MWILGCSLRVSLLFWKLGVENADIGHFVSFPVDVLHSETERETYVKPRRANGAIFIRLPRQMIVEILRMLLFAIVELSDEREQREGFYGWCGILHCRPFVFLEVYQSL